MTTEGKDAVGALDYTPEERRVIICLLYILNIIINNFLYIFVF